MLEGAPPAASRRQRMSGAKLLAPRVTVPGGHELPTAASVDTRKCMYALSFKTKIKLLGLLPLNLKMCGHT
jgi:hypothetical protein